MIGFSASFAQTIKLILDELRETDKFHYYIFNEIILAISEGNNSTYINVSKDRYGEVIDILDYNGFECQRINESLILVKW